MGYDKAAAEAYKAEADEKVKALEAELDGMEKTKENKKKITEMGKEINAIKKAGQYTDALKVIKGEAPTKGFFIVGADPSAGAEKKKEKKEEKKEEGAAPAKEEGEKEEKVKKVKAGLTKDEKAELNKLKDDIIARKALLKGEGKSAGECNKD